MSEEKVIKRSFSSFNNISEVCKTFNYDYQKKSFIKTKKYTSQDNLKKELLEDFEDDKNFTNEYAICESIIRPILSRVSKPNNLPLWSHVNLSSKVNSIELSGAPDYLLALAEPGRLEYKIPVVCLGEAKNGILSNAWGQVGAEMIAAQKVNNNYDIPIYGLVSIGSIWGFGKLENNLFTLEPDEYIAPKELDAILDILNWIFCEARKNADIILNTK